MIKKKKKKKASNGKRGRPPVYSEEKADLICALIASGYSLTSICKLDGMPNYVTVMRWLWDKSPVKDEFSNKYARAREMQAERFADELIDIADDGTNDYGFKSGKDKDGEGASSVFLKENVLRSKLRVDTRKWIAAKLLPKKYGEKAEVELGVKGVKLVID